MKIQSAILSTLAYHSIFLYPLTFEEIYKYLIGTRTTKEEQSKALKALLHKKKVYGQNGLYCLPRQQSILKIRAKREAFSRQKLKKALFYARLLKFIPTISAVCLTGALAMQNSSKSDDIDLLVITNKKSLWTSRFFANLILLPYKRKPYARNNSNKACLNIFLDSSDLKIKDKNIYTAHEIFQMKILWGTIPYRKLLSANNWAKNFLPNWKSDALSRGESGLNLTVPNFIEEFFKKLQLFYMSSRLTVEKVGDRQVFFHPLDTEQKIIKQYQSRIKKIIDKPAHNLR